MDEEFIVKVEPPDDFNDNDTEILSPGSKYEPDEDTDANLACSESGDDDTEKEGFVCKICAKTFTRRDHLVRHLKNKNVHGNGKVAGVDLIKKGVHRVKKVAGNV